MNVTTVGIDLAKNVFSVHGVGRDGKVLLRRSVGRADLLPMFAQMPPCLICMEACSGGAPLRAGVAPSRREKRDRPRFLCSFISKAETIVCC